MTDLLMQKASNEQQSKLVLGLGQTGLSCVRYFVRNGIDVVVYDTRVKPPMLETLKNEFPKVKVYTGLIDEAVLDTVEEVLLSPGLSLETPIVQAAIQRGIPVLGDVEIFARVAKAPIIAVTGSNGKSTTVSMITSILEQAHRNVRLGGNIGVPVLDLLKENEPEFYVLELSSFQLETTDSLTAKVAVILNVSEDHMDRYSSLHDYAVTKQKICQGSEVCLINSDDSWLKEFVSPADGIHGFTLGKPEAGQYGLLKEDDETFLCHGDDKLMSANDLKVKGQHQIANALVAFAVTEICGVPREAIRHTLAGFEGLPHRTQFVTENNGVIYINDSKGTNVGATQAAIDGFSQPIVLIAGGVGKGADFTALRSSVKGKVKHAILIGEDAQLIADALEGEVELQFANDLVDAVNKASAVAEPGDIVLLSPACASFDMFDDYQHRGNVFVEAVGRLVSHEY